MDFSIRMPGVLDQLRNALDDFAKTDRLEEWAKDVKDTFAKICKQLHVSDDEKFPSAKIYGNIQNCCTAKT